MKIFKNNYLFINLNYKFLSMLDVQYKKKAKINKLLLKFLFIYTYFLARFIIIFLNN